MEILKVKSKETYENKEGKVCHYYNYYIKLDNGTKIQIKPSFKSDSAKLDVIASIVK